MVSMSLILPIRIRRSFDRFRWFCHRCVDETCVYFDGKLHCSSTFLSKWNRRSIQDSKISVLIRRMHSTYSCSLILYNASVNRLRKISDLIGLIIICHIWLLYPCRNDSVLRRKYVIEVDIMSLRVSLVEKKHCQRIQHNPMSPRWIDEIVANKFIYLFNWSVQSLTKKLPAPSTYALDLLKRDT